MVARALSSISLPALPRLSPILARRLALAAAALVVLTGAWLWLRDSPLVAVDDVTVIGAGGPQSASITEALETAAREQTTLHVSTPDLMAAAREYPIVRAVHAKADFPHGLQISVVQWHPVLAAVAGSQRVAIASDGTLLRGTPAGGVPTVEVKTLPAGATLDDPKLESKLRLLAAAPAPLRAKVASVFTGPRGLSLKLRSGGRLYFGSSSRVAAKWAAATAVLADSSSRGATNVDVRVPEFPTAGGLEQIAAQESPTQDATSSPPTPTGPSGAAPQTP